MVVVPPDPDRVAGHQKKVFPGSQLAGESASVSVGLGRFQCRHSGVCGGAKTLMKLDR